ncbi:MAG: winged helix-turn-helix transcriptional regulator [Thermoleophilia bacterium]|nr:winged helix-turn-helix transcriptional regulator [Thermoleophilia bacterium]
MHRSSEDCTRPPGSPPESAGLDEASAALFRAFGQALRLHRQFMARRLGETDLHPGQAACLGVLAHRDGIAQRDLAEALHIAPPTLSRMLQSMEKNGVVERRDDEADQRLSRVYMTDAGRTVAREMRAAMADHIPVAVAALSDDERVELARLLDKLSASIALSLGDDGPGARAGTEQDGRAGEAGRARHGDGGSR